MKELKNLKFKSVTPQDILQVVGLLDKLGYEVVRNDFSANDAAKHNGLCAWADGEITEGWLDEDNFEKVTLEELKEMVEVIKNKQLVLWLNKETLEERYLGKFSVFPYHSSWVEVPEGVTFATGDKDNFVFRKDGWYYEDGVWVETNVLLKHFPEYKHIKLFWVKSDVKVGILSNNFSVAWEQVFGEKFVDSVIKAVKQNKEGVVKNDKFTLERLLGCEVMFCGEIGYICNTYNYHGGVVHLLIDGCVVSSKPSYLKFFTEHGDELTFDEYVSMYYGGDV